MLTLPKYLKEFLEMVIFTILIVMFIREAKVNKTNWKQLTEEVAVVGIVLAFIYAII
jgi:hypothetical protein